MIKKKNEILLYFLSKMGFLRIIMLDSTEKTFDFSDEYFAINISEKPFKIYDHKTESNIVYKNTKISGNSRGLMKALREFNYDFFSSGEILYKSKMGKYFKVT